MFREVVIRRIDTKNDVEVKEENSDKSPVHLYTLWCVIRLIESIKFERDGRCLLSGVLEERNET